MIQPCQIQDLVYCSWNDPDFKWDNLVTWNGTIVIPWGIADWDDCNIPWDAVTNDWEGKEIPLIPELEIRDDSVWERPRPPSEGVIITEHWREIFPPEAVSCWAIQWNTGDIVYYRWVMVNPCISCTEKGSAIRRVLHV